MAILKTMDTENSNNYEEIHNQIENDANQTLRIYERTNSEELKRINGELTENNQLDYSLTT